MWLAFRSTGYLGVSFFFVLSGFVLTWSRSAARGTGRFYWLRFARVWPLHALTALIAGLMPGVWIPPGTSGVVEVLTGLHSWDPRGHVHYGLNGVSWSLSCEAFFYLLFPLLAPALERLTRRGLALLTGVVLAAMLAVPLLTTGTAVGPRGLDDPAWLWFNLPAYRLGEFLVGVAAGVAFTRGWRLRMPLAVPLLLVAGWLVVPTAQRLQHADMARHFVAWPLIPLFAAVIVVAAGQDVSGRRGLLRSNVAVRLGECSFALYLVHQLAVRVWLQTGHGHRASATGFATLLGWALAAAALLHWGFERPVERWLRARSVGQRGRHRGRTPGGLAPEPVADPAGARLAGAGLVRGAPGGDLALAQSGERPDARPSPDADPSGRAERLQ